MGIVAGEWVLTRANRHIVYVRVIKNNRAYVINVRDETKRGWIDTAKLKHERDIITRYNAQYWQPDYDTDEYLED